MAKKLIEQELLKILASAIKDEKRSETKYNRFAERAVNYHSKRLFKKLAEDELDHQRALQNRYIRIKKQLGLKIMKSDPGQADKGK